MSFSKHHNPLSQTLTLPQHLIFEEILPKLPAKSLIRFKSISKSWFSTISSPDFAKLHLHFSSSCSKFLMLTKYVDDDYDEFDIFFVRYNEFDCAIKDMSRLEFRSCPISRVDIVSLLGSCNGLVCLWMLNYIICWNPVTNQVRQINYPSDDSAMRLFQCHFSYASSNDEYRLFAAFKSEVDSWMHCYMFSWSTGEWRSYVELSNRCPRLTFRYVFLIDDIVYLLFRDRIIGFCLANEEIIESPPLDWMSTYRMRNWNIVQLRGCLSLICITDVRVCHVWMLKRHCEWNSWEKLFSVNFANVDFYGMSETGKCLVKHEGKLKVFDPSCGNAVQELSPMGIDFDDVSYTYVVFNSQSYVESLVSPF